MRRGSGYRSQGGVLFDLLELLVGEAAGLAEDAFGGAKLADVVKERGAGRVPHPRGIPCRPRAS